LRKGGGGFERYWFLYLELSNGKIPKWNIERLSIGAHKKHAGCEKRKKKEKTRITRSIHKETGILTLRERRGAVRLRARLPQQRKEGGAVLGNATVTCLGEGKGKSLRVSQRATGKGVVPNE